MGGSTCAVAICRNYSTKTKRAQKNITYFRFPKNTNIRKRWVQKCYRNDIFNPENSTICTEHFTREDFADDLKARLLNLTPKKLKHSAVPSLNLLPPDISSGCRIHSQTPQDKGAHAKKQKEIVTTHVSEVPMKEVDLKTLPSASEESDLNILKRHYDKITKVNESFKESLEEAQNKVSELKTKILETKIKS